LPLVSSISASCSVSNKTQKEGKSIFMPALRPDSSCQRAAQYLLSLLCASE
jgi:hypothetical protein